MVEGDTGMELRVHKMGLNLKGIVEMGNRCIAMDVKVHIIRLGIGGFASQCVGEAGLLGLHRAYPKALPFGTLY